MNDKRIAALEAAIGVLREEVERLKGSQPLQAAQTPQVTPREVELIARRRAALKLGYSAEAYIPEHIWRQELLEAELEYKARFAYMNRVFPHDMQMGHHKWRLLCIRLLETCVS
jgi:hypothetical protein